MYNNCFIVNNVSENLKRIAETLNERLLYEFDQNLMIKDKNNNIICTINYNEELNVNIMTFKNLSIVFTEKETEYLNDFLQNHTIYDSIMILLDCSNSYNSQVTNFLNLFQGIFMFNAKGVNVLMTFNYFTNKVLVVTESSKGKNIANLEPSRCKEYLDQYIVSTFFVPSNANKKIRRVKIRGATNYITSETSPTQFEFDNFKNKLIESDSDSDSEHHSRQWLTDASNAMNAFEQQLKLQYRDTNDIIGNCFNNNLVTNNNNQITKPKFTSDYVDDYVYDPADFGGSNIRNNIRENINSNDSNSIENQIKRLSGFDREVVKTLHMVNLSELKQLYDNNFSEKVKNILNYFDQFPDTAIDNIRNILKSSGL